MLGDPVWMWQNAGKVLLVVGLMVLGKMAVIAIIAKIFGLPTRHAVATGACLAQVGEFGVVIAGIGHTSGLFGESVFRLLVSSTLLALLVTPYLVRYALSIGRAVERMLPWLGRPPQTSSPGVRNGGRTAATRHRRGLWTVRAGRWRGAGPEKSRRRGFGHAAP